MLSPQRLTEPHTGGRMIPYALVHTAVAIGAGASALHLVAHAAYRATRPVVSTALLASAMCAAGLAAGASYIAAIGGGL